MEMLRRLLLVLPSTLALGCASGPRAVPCPGTAVQQSSSLSDPVAERRESAPRLVVWLTIDQLRGDYYLRHRHHFGEGGFARLFEGGVWYQDAHFSHAITETAPGHATLFTGASPRRHGIVANSWLDDDGTEIASVADVEFPLVGPGVENAPSGDEHFGRSPRRLLMPTVADSIIQSTAGQGRVVSISIKDRGAILPSGRAGRAFWWGPQGFVTSRYYGQEVPEWLHRNHESHPPESYLSRQWSLLLDEKAYRSLPATSPHAFAGFGVGFPHRFEGVHASARDVKSTPFGDVAVLDLARSALVEESLGRDDSVDLLALSLSSTDYIGHVFGPESREMEDQLVRLDRQLDEFFGFLDETVGRERVLLVLSADHGGCESSEYLERLGIAAARLTEGEIQTRVEQALESHFQHTRYLRRVASPYVYLDHLEMEKDSRTPDEVVSVVTAAVRSMPAVFTALSSAESSPDQGSIARKIGEAVFPGRSGDIYVVPRPYVAFLQEETLAATHGSPWEYDSHVPVVLAGPGIAPRLDATRVDVRSLAPTVAHLIGVNSPAGSSAPILPGFDR